MAENFYENLPCIPKFDNIDPYSFSIDASAAGSKKVLHNVTTNALMSKEEEEKLTPGRKNLRKWLGKTFRVLISDGRVLIGFFNCTDKDANLVLSMCAEYLEEGKEARILGNVMIPGKHIVSISVDIPRARGERLKKLPMKRVETPQNK